MKIVGVLQNRMRTAMGEKFVTQYCIYIILHFTSLLTQNIGT